LVGIVEGTDLTVSWSDCGDADTIAKITSFTPGTVTLGKEETLTGTGSVSKDVSGGSFNINLKAGILIHETFTGDICKAKSFHLPLNTGTVTWNGMTCPQAKGNAAVSLKIQLAASLPASFAAAVIEAKAKTSSGDDLLCMEVKTNPARDDIEKQFEHFTNKHGKFYENDAERKNRFENFKQSLVKIEAKNVQEILQGGGAIFDVTSLSDLSTEEFKTHYLGLQIPVGMRNLSTFVPQKSGLGVASSIDWVSRGAVTPIKNQGQCGSCWTFSTTGAIEGAWQIATGELVSLSEQQIVDCSSSGGRGCSGGWPIRAIEWEESQSICGENGYPYTAQNGYCHSCSSPVLPQGSVTGAQSVSASTSALKAALAEVPVSVCVDAEEWQHYTGGIFSNCGTSLDHAVLAVGYDASSFKIKNSWGTGWGESGYIRLAMGDTCGVLENAVVAIVSGSSPSPAPTPSPSPCDTCTWNSDCAYGEDCYYPTASATSGCCSSTPPAVTV